MKKTLLIVCGLFAWAAQAQTFYSQDFNGAHGWTLNVPTGTEGADPNFFNVSDDEGGVTPNGCGVVSNGDATLHVTSVFNPTGGASYDAGGLCGFLFCPQTDRRAESPVINCSGYSSITLSFDYIAGGDPGNDYASVLYFDGSTWNTLPVTLSSPVCGGGQGQWTAFSTTLPASANNNPNVKVGFHWINNDDGVGTDPSLAVNNVTLSAVAPLLVSLSSSTNVSCFGGNTGSATVAASGGTGTLTYSWTPTGGTAATASGLSAGNYTCTVTDGIGATVTQTVTITEPPAIVATGVITSPPCNGGTGSIDVSVSGGTPMSGGPGLVISEVLPDPSGTDSPFEFVELLATKAIDFSVTPYTVIFSNNGTATANGWRQGAAITYAFQISSGSVTPGQVVYVGGSSMIPVTNVLRSINTGTTAGDGGIGNSNATGVLGNGGTSADGVAIFNVGAAALTSTTVPVDALFYGTALGNAVVSGGTAGYELPVNDMYSGGKLQTTSFFTTAFTATQFLKASGVYDMATNTWTTPRTWSSTASFTNLATSVSLSNIYTYSWSNGPVTEDISGVPAGTYTLNITDGNSCPSSTPFTITEPAPVSAMVTQTNVSCNGMCDGTATVNGIGGTAPYVYAWSIGSTTPTISNLCAGTYTVQITDMNGCVGTVTVTITEPPAITGSQTLTICSGQSVTVGTNTYTATGTFTDVLTAANGCDSIVTTNLTVLAPITGSQTLAICAGASVTVGTNTYTTSGTYTDTLSAANSCDSIVTTNLTVENVIDVSTSLNAETITANATSASYQWIDCDNGNTPISSETGQSFTATVNGNYAVIVTVNSCSDTSACVNIASIGLRSAKEQLSIHVYPNPSSGVFMLQLPEDISFTVRHTLGEVIKSGKLTAGTQKIDLGDQSNGIFLLQIENEEASQLIKLVKQD